MKKLDPVAVDPPRTPRTPHDPAKASSCADWPHRMEQAVQRRLLAQPGLRFSSLVIRRIPNGVCLEGVLEKDGEFDVCHLARDVVGVDQVLNHLVERQTGGAF